MNINEIARLAGVSRATVSRYLNNGYVSSEKKEVIRKVIQETGYQPSSQAQTLRTKKTSLIGVILPKINSDTISREVEGISDILTRRGYQLILANTNNDLEEELKYLSLFKERQVDGVVFIATMFTRKHKQMLKDYKVPIVLGPVGANSRRYIAAAACAGTTLCGRARLFYRVLLRHRPRRGCTGMRTA